jgi:hypothetical protein
MAEACPPAAPATDAGAGDDLRSRIETLRARGVDRFDAVGWRVLDAMLRRLDDFEGAARTALQRKIARRLTALRERFERADGEARGALERAAVRSSGAGAAQARPEARPLAELLAHVACQSGAVETSAGLAQGGGVTQPGAELKSLRYFRSTWSRISLEQQLSRALAQAPDNAGPLNSHFLVLQALIRMRDVAPAYLEGFIAYAEALRWLEQADAERAAASRAAVQKPAARKVDARTQGARARKPARGRVG